MFRGLRNLREIILVGCLFVLLTIFLFTDHFYFNGFKDHKELDPLRKLVTGLESKRLKMVNSSVITFMNGDEHRNDDPNLMRIAIVTCGPKRLEQTFVVIKSACMMNTLSRNPIKNSRIHFMIMTDEDGMNIATMFVKNFPPHIFNSISFEIWPIYYPKMTPSQTQTWRNLFKLCASQRLFIPDLFPHVDSLLYVDNDVLFLSPPDELYKYLGQMNSTQMTAMAAESQDYSTGWYNRFAKHPYVKPLGVNSGVMLMNLTRFRQFNWIDRVMPIFEQYESRITWGDQDIINILLSNNTDKLLKLPCHYNYRQDFCLYKSVCKPAETGELRNTDGGIKVFHGSRDVFHSNKQKTFRVTYETFREFDWRFHSVVRDNSRAEFNSQKAVQHFVANLWDNLRNVINGNKLVNSNPTGLDENLGVICDKILFDTVQYSLLGYLDVDPDQLNLSAISASTQSPHVSYHLRKLERIF